MTIAAVIFVLFLIACYYHGKHSPAIQQKITRLCARTADIVGSAERGMP